MNKKLTAALLSATLACSLAPAPALARTSKPAARPGIARVTNARSFHEDVPITDVGMRALMEDLRAPKEQAQATNDDQLVLVLDQETGRQLEAFVEQFGGTNPFANAERPMGGAAQEQAPAEQQVAPAFGRQAPAEQQAALNANRLQAPNAGQMQAPAGEASFGQNVSALPFGQQQAPMTQVGMPNGSAQNQTPMNEAFAAQGMAQQQAPTAPSFGQQQMPTQQQAPAGEATASQGMAQQQAPTTPSFGQQQGPAASASAQQGGNGQQSASFQFGGQELMPGQVMELGDSGMQLFVAGTTDTAGEIVLGVMTNSAAGLEADYENAVYIVMSDENCQVKIDESGTYVISGTCSDGNITVKKSTTGVVLVLEDLDLTSTTGATMSLNKNSETKIIISGNVTLTDNEDPNDEYSEDENVADAYDGAALKVKDNAVAYLTGDGTLTINGNAKNGIKVGDEASLVIDGATTTITAANDGINSNYDLTILSGDLTISAEDDAIHADRVLTIGAEDGSGPTVNVTKSTEGLEGTVVNIFGGETTITSSDDAINAANADAAYEGELEYAVNMTGGSVTINSRADGIDSNGDVNLVGGSATISSASNGGDAGIDYDGDLYVSESFQLNNRSGVAGPDNMMGGMGGQQGMAGQQGMGGVR